MGHTPTAPLGSKPAANIRRRMWHGSCIMATTSERVLSCFRSAVTTSASTPAICARLRCRRRKHGTGVRGAKVSNRALGGNSGAREREGAQLPSRARRTRRRAGVFPRPPVPRAGRVAGEKKPGPSQARVTCHLFAAAPVGTLPSWRGVCGSVNLSRCCLRPRFNRVDSTPMWSHPFVVNCPLVPSAPARGC